VPNAYGRKIVRKLATLEDVAIAIDLVPEDVRLQEGEYSL
jgi:hypothetical protein